MKPGSTLPLDDGLSAQAIDRAVLLADPELLEDLKTFCQIEVDSETSQPTRNLEVEDWENKPNTLLFQLLKTERYTAGNGIFFLIRSGDQGIVSTAGVYRSHFHPDVAIGGARTWTAVRFRGKYVHSLHLLPLQMNWCRANGFKMMMSGMNEENTKRFKRWQAEYKKYTPNYLRDFEYWPRQTYFNNAKQWVIYIKFDPGFSFDFDSLR